MSPSTLADACGVSGHRRRRHVPLLPARRRPAARCPTSSSSSTGTPRLQHRLEQLRAERRRRVAAERAERLAAHAARRSGAGDAPRRLLGRLRPRRACGVFTGQYGANPGSTLSADAQRSPTGCSCRGERGRCCSVAARAGSYPPPFARRRRRYPIPVRRQPRRTTSTSSIPTSRSRTARSLDGQLPARAVAATWRSTSATSARAASTSGPKRTTTSEYNLIENGFFDEFQAGDGEPAGQQRRRRQPRRLVRLLRPGHRHVAAADLPRLLQRLAATSTTRRAYTGANWTNTTFAGRLVRTNPNPTNAAGDLDGNADAPRQRAHAPGLRRNFFVAQPGRRRRATSTTARRSATTTRCRSSCGAGCRAASRSTAATSTRSRAARRSSACTTAA